MTDNENSIRKYEPLWGDWHVDEEIEALDLRPGEAGVLRVIDGEERPAGVAQHGLNAGRVIGVGQRLPPVGLAQAGAVGGGAIRRVVAVAAGIVAVDFNG